MQDWLDPGLWVCIRLQRESVCCEEGATPGPHKRQHLTERRERKGVEKAGKVAGHGQPGSPRRGQKAEARKNSLLSGVAK